MTSNDYSLGSCIEGKISEKVGCKPLWINTSEIEFPFCTHRHQYLEFMETLTKYEQMNTIQLNQLGCHKPCEFMEYKVKGKEPIQNEFYRFQLYKLLNNLPDSWQSTADDSSKHHPALHQV